MSIQKLSAFLLIAPLFFVLTCGAQPLKTDLEPTVNTTSFKHPDWIKDKTIYEVNLRQYSQTGTFDEFRKSIPRLKKMGVDILWFMPIHPIGEKNRKGSLGSYYSVKNYTAVNEEHGTLKDFKAVVKEAHNQGMYVILDWVANHTAWDSEWAKAHPDWFLKDKKGNFMPPEGTDWSDVIDLDYSNKEMRKAMIESLLFWVKEADIDGYRCDVASWVPLDFWQEARKALDEEKPVFMLAEAEELNYHNRAFDMSYAWALNKIFNEIAAGKKDVKALDRYWEKEKKAGLEDRFRMIFTTNHDENTWHGTVYERLGKGAEAFAVLTVTMPSMPLLYSGQEAGMDKRLKFFEKDVIDWNGKSVADFYTKLFMLKKKNPALWIGEEMGEMKRLKTGADKNVFAFVRVKNGHAVLTLVNLSDKKQNVQIDFADFEGEYSDLFSEKSIKAGTELKLELEPWGYRVWYR